MTSLIDSIEETSGAIEATDAGSLQDQIHVADTGESLSEAPDTDLTEGVVDAGKASESRPPEDDKQETQDSLVDRMTPDAPEEEKKDETDSKTDTDTEEGEEADVDAEARALKADLLGVSEDEPETDPVWKKRYDDTVQELREISQKTSDKEAQLETLLKSLGRTIINTKDGLQLAVSDEAKDFKAEDIDVDSIVNSLSDKELKMFGTEDEVGDPKEAANIIATKLASVFAEKVPPVTAKPSDQVLSIPEQNAIYNDFVSEKLGDGKTPRFPDCDKPEVQKELELAFKATDDRIEALKEAAQKDAKINAALLEFIWLRTFRTTHAVKSLTAARKQELDQKNSENKQSVSVTGSGGNQGGKGASSAPMSQRDAVSAFLDDVGKGGEMLNPEFGS